MVTPKIKVALADDHNLFRKGLVGLLNRFNNCHILFEADNGRELIDQLNLKNMPDIIIMDLNMPLMDGFETVAWLRNHHPDVRVLILSMLDNENAILRVLRLGVRGYLLKDADPAELKDAIESIYKKGFYYSDYLTGQLIHTVNTYTDDGSESKAMQLSHLSEKEIEFLKHCCTEFTYKEISAKMGISSRTVDNYREDLFEKLGVKTRIGLALYAVKNGLVIL
jgi:two-component system, NarL family, invasion response regulator UvrY